MIAVKISGPRAELAPAVRRRVAVALGLALAVALKRAGSFEGVEARSWRGVPDVAYVGGEKVDIELGRRVDVGVVESIAGRKKWDGITVTLNGELGKVKLGVDIDIYADEYVPVRAGITDEGLDVLAEPRGHVGGGVVESFYELFDVEHERMRAVVEEFIAEMRRVALKAACPLWRAAARVYALRDYGFAPEDAMPLWYRPWIAQMARDLYRMAPPGLRELAGPYGMRRIVKGVAPELLKRLERYYDVKPHEDALQLIPLSAEAHRGAVADLRDVLTSLSTAANMDARKTIDEKGYLGWEEYVEALEKELRQRLTSQPRGAHEGA